METARRKAQYASTTSGRHCSFRVAKVATCLIAIAVQASASLGWASSAGPGQAGEIPFRLYNNNLIVVKGDIGSLTGVNLILDTGTSSTIVSKSTANRLKLRGSAEELHMVNGTVQTESFALPHIRIGAMSAENLKVVLQDLGFVEQSVGTSIAAIVGIDLLSSHNFTVDYGKRKISFAATPTHNSVPLAGRSPLLMVKTRIDSHELRLVLDTGTPVLMLFRNRLQGMEALLNSALEDMIVTGAGRTQMRSYRLPVVLGEQGLGVRAIRIADADIDPEAGFDGLLGFAAVGFRRISFNFDTGVFGWE